MLYKLSINNTVFKFNLCCVSFHSYLIMTQITQKVGMQCVHNNYVYILSAIVMQPFHINVPSGGIMGYP